MLKYQRNVWERLFSWRWNGRMNQSMEKQLSFVSSEISSIVEKKHKIPLAGASTIMRKHNTHTSDVLIYNSAYKRIKKSFKKSAKSSP